MPTWTILWFWQHKQNNDRGLTLGAVWDEPVHPGVSACVSAPVLTKNVPLSLSVATGCVSPLSPLRPSPEKTNDECSWVWKVRWVCSGVCGSVFALSKCSFRLANVWKIICHWNMLTRLFGKMTKLMQNCDQSHGTRGKTTVMESDAFYESDFYQLLICLEVFIQAQASLTDNWPNI